MSGWSPERIERLKTLWAQGLTASQIADRLGGVTRNAVCGKIDRLGLPGRKTGKFTRRARRATVARSRKTRTPFKIGALASDEHKRRARETVDKALEPLDCDPVPSERIGIMELIATTCRWPCGDPRDEDFGYCGRHSEPGTPYCEYHDSISSAGRPVRVRPDLNRPFAPQNSVEVA